VASRLKAYVVWGFMESLDGRLFNSSSIAGPNGRVLTTHRKMNLWGNDFLWASPGRSFGPEILETEIGLLATVVCRDARDKIPTNVPRTAARATEPPMFGGRCVDVVALPVNWGKGGFPAVPWMDLAAENRCTVVVANRWGEERNGAFVQDFGQGGSAVVSPDWKVRTDGLKFGQDCVVTVAVESLR
jgi:predicted amidohydrolase